MDESLDTICPSCGSAEIRWIDTLGSVALACCRRCGTVYEVPEA